jgi:serine/threonine protein phosphatase PrpC
MSMITATHITSFAVCEQGRRDYNDDTFADADLMAGRALVVSDGAGGHRGGAIAARVVIDQVLLHLAKAPQWTDRTLTDAVDAASVAVRRRQSEDRALSKMSATVVVLCLDVGAGVARWAHLGDSRAYLFRRGIAQQLTRDHSVLQSFADAGLLDSMGGGQPDRSVLYAAVGAEGETRPEVASRDDLEEGDAFLLCTDGMWDTVPVGDCERLLGFAGSVQEWVESIAAAVRAAASPTQDNYTVLAAWVGSPTEITVIRA